ncbi:Rrf2 family transcriptional regulator [Kineobactrum salinum]|uniref:Rrf2 family transcriptional regulator n=1 Tax=Kineobactrum salinum TaxID=2708301 RepID=A0A6C0U4J5_9GAMM|nr:Rrf2 family transcriptional regulator [Kineobactrum salinum]QIB66926.1 Rrf2 family transcriptional regulator [Kineobactrum salinum]
MRITRYTDYSLRVLLYAALKGDALSTIGEVAGAYNISKNHLMKVVQELSAKGYLQAIRGKNGGMRLGRTPKDINVGTLVRELEQDLELVECFGNSSNCVITPSCKLKRILGEALNAFFSTLDRYTLADLLPGANEPEIYQLLGLTELTNAASADEAGR